MHMADALISPAVGAAMWGATGVVVAYSARHVRSDLDESKIPLMGVAGAFVFAAQMVNFAIPGTGSSGHLGGALLLAILLGPEAAFLVMASILAVQALFFADGGLLALGCNIFNLGFFPAFVAYPLVYRKIVGDGPDLRAGRVFAGALLAAVVGLQLGALAVVLETTASGVSDLPFSTFLLLMQPIHLVIGVVEGLVTAVVVLFVYSAQPELLARTAARRSLRGLRLWPVVLGACRGGAGRRRGAVPAGLHAAGRPRVVDRRRDVCAGARRRRRGVGDRRRRGRRGRGRGGGGAHRGRPAPPCGPASCPSRDVAEPRPQA